MKYFTCEKCSGQYCAIDHSNPTCSHYENGRPFETINLSRRQRGIVRILFDAAPEARGFPLSGHFGRSITALQEKGLVTRDSAQKSVVWLLTNKGREVAGRTRGP